MRWLPKVMRWLQKRGVFFWTVVITALVVVFIDLVFPYLAQVIVQSPNALPVPRTLRLWYLILIGASIAIYILSSDATLGAFLDPIRQAATGRSGLEQIIFRAVMIILPLLAGATVISMMTPSAKMPSAVRQQHPGMASSIAAPYAGKQNPLRKPSESALAAFGDRYAALPGPEDEYDSRPKKVDLQTLSPQAFQELFVTETVNEGRSLYFKNCLPCHGAKFDGDGLASGAWSLKPINFRDPGTIATLVEDAAFWRVNEGGIGLPPVATPWDSVMPRWKVDFTEDEIWKVIVAEYHDAGVKPRVLEFRLEGANKDGGQ